MDPLLVLPMLVTLWCVVFVTQMAIAARRSRTPVGAWIVKVALVLAGVAASVLLKEQTLVYAVSALWFVVLVVPAFLANWQARALALLDYRRAYRLALFMRLLHPFGGWRAAPAQIALLAAARAGDAAAVDGLRPHLADRALLPILRVQIVADIARITGDWERLLSEPVPRGAESLRLRALGETGRLSALVDAYAASPPDPVSDLMLLAFSGRTAGVEVLLSIEPSSRLTPMQKEFWRATAALLDNPDDAAAKTRLIANTEGPQRDTLIARRLDGALAAPSTLTPDDLAFTMDVERVLLDAQAAGRLPVPQVPTGLPFVTLALIAANLVAFGIELWQGGWAGPTDLDVLYDLGALWPPAVVDDGEWSRLVTAMFLHYGMLHLVFNMLGLLAFGRLIEARLGRFGMLFTYAATGLGSMLGLIVMTEYFGSPPELLVGASGAIMGIVGAFAGLLARDALKRRLGAMRRLGAIAAIVLLQVGFDLMIPEVSFGAHAFGFFVGLPIGFLLADLRSRRGKGNISGHSAASVARPTPRL